MTIVTQQISGQLSPRRVAAYMKKRHKDVPIRVERCQEDENALYLSDGGWMCLKTAQHFDLAQWMNFPSLWERATFPKGEIVPQEGGVSQSSFFRSWGKTNENHVLTLTNDLREIPGARNKPGTFYRLLTYPKAWNIDERRELVQVYIDKRLLDIFSPDLDELQGFLFETSGQHKPVRVSAVNGIVGYVMPGYNIEREWVR